jgi:hypothetical protein
MPYRKSADTTLGLLAVVTLAFAVAALIVMAFA